MGQLLRERVPLCRNCRCSTLITQSGSVRVSKEEFSGIIINETTSMPSTATYCNRFQSLRRAYELVGYLKTLPADYVGERHVVIVKREPSGATGQDEWCEFEERPGPAPLDAQEDYCTTIYIVYRDRLNPQGGRKRSTHDECAEAT